MTTVSKEKESKAWVNGVAGGLGSAASKTLMSPIQRLTMLRQLGHRKESLSELCQMVIDKERRSLVPKGEPLPPQTLRHWVGFYRGNLVSVCQRIPYSGIQLMVYDRLKHAIRGGLSVADDDVVSTKATGAKVISSATAAAVSGASTYPMEVVRTRLMSNDPRCTGILATLRVIAAEPKGLLSFYNGLSVSLVQRIPDIVINLTVYESVKFYLGKQGYSDKVCVCAGGASAALTAIAITYPIDVVKRRIAAGGSGKTTYAGPRDCALQMLKTDPRAFYAGGTLEAVRCVPQVIIMWSAIEYFRTVLSGL